MWLVMLGFRVSRIESLSWQDSTAVAGYVCMHCQPLLLLGVAPVGTSSALLAFRLRL
jgi:hypothetical protein